MLFSPMKIIKVVLFVIILLRLLFSRFLFSIIIWLILALLVLDSHGPMVSQVSPGAGLDLTDTWPIQTGLLSLIILQINIFLVLSWITLPFSLDFL